MTDQWIGSGCKKFSYAQSIIIFCKYICWNNSSDSCAVASLCKAVDLNIIPALFFNSPLKGLPLYFIVPLSACLHLQAFQPLSFCNPSRPKQISGCTLKLTPLTAISYLNCLCNWFAWIIGRIACLRLLKLNRLFKTYIVVNCEKHLLMHKKRAERICRPCPTLLACKH